MKVYIKDKRVNPRVIYIDGKRFILPSNKEVLKDISKAAFVNLSGVSFLSLREYTDIDEGGVKGKPTKEELVNREPDRDETPVQEEPKTEEAPKEEPKTEAAPVDVSGLVVEDKLEDSTIIPQTEEPKSEEQEAQTASTDYSSLTKKELKALVEEKGGDPTGMTKANLLDWLKANA